MHGFRSHRIQTYENSFSAFPALFFGRDDIEKGNKIILPPSVAQILVQMHISYPMLFEIRNNELDTFTHCGVLEFTAEEGTCIIPFWMMQNLLLEEGSQVKIKNVKLNPGRFIKLQPQETAFIDLPNPRAVLENALRFYSCLTKGEMIIVEFNKKRYELLIMETRPDDAIMTIETDIEVDFAPPKDYQEAPPALAREPSITSTEEKLQKATAAGKVFPGSGQCVDVKKTAKSEPVRKPSQSEAEEYDPRKHRLRNGIRGPAAAVGRTHWEGLKQGRTLD